MNLGRISRVSLFFIVLSGCSRPPAGVAGAPAVVVIGVDGMDPAFVERHWEDLPNLRALRDRGSFRRLQTTTPPQSPVAWSTFITGLDPAGHGIYDFVHRDPTTMAPYSSMDRTEPPRFQLPVGPWLLPLSKGHVISLRHGTPFWKLLADRGVPVTMMRMPTNYPPVDAGYALSGMGVPDIRGGFGTYTFYTDDPEEITRSVPGGSIVRMSLVNGRAALSLDGPPNSLRRDQRTSSVPMIVDVDPAARAARVKLGDSAVIVQAGEWSDWMPADFPLIPHVSSVHGMVRVYARQLAPRFQLYVTPVNVDPRRPALPISAPPGFSGQIARAVGPFFTQGIAEDTAALRNGVFDLREYLAQSRMVFADERKFLRYSLKQFQSGLLFVYFSVVDQNSHMLWGRFGEELLGTYRSVDEAIGEAVRGAPKADFIVMSDHGFASFNRGFQLNAWLRENAYLSVGRPSAAEGFAGVDWSRTRAYGLG